MNRTYLHLLNVAGIEKTRLADELGRQLEQWGSWYCTKGTFGNHCFQTFNVIGWSSQGRESTVSPQMCISSSLERVQRRYGKINLDRFPGGSVYGDVYFLRELHHSPQGTVPRVIRHWQLLCSLSLLESFSLGIHQYNILHIASSRAANQHVWNPYFSATTHCWYRW